jgi:predicted transcriptional regulator
MSAIGKILRELREAKGLTIGRAALEADTSYNTLRGYETGAVNPTAVLERILDLYGCDLEIVDREL